MLQENINPIIELMEDKCHMWENYKLFWFGRVTVVKMVLLPKLIFVKLNTDIDIPEAILNKIQATVNTFIWNRQRPRLKLTTVRKKLPNGELPDG